MNVPFVDLARETALIESQFLCGMQDILANSHFIGGKYVEDFELQFAASHQFKQVVSCGNGTDAIMIALRALGIGPGDEVIVPAQTWISTASAVNATGATPVFCDIDPYNCIDPERLDSLLSAKTKAIIVVHLYGMPAEMNAIQTFCNVNNLYLIEDCAQAHFARYNDNLVGHFGDIATFSFYPSKNLGAFGDAGCMATNDLLLGEKMKFYARHGGPKKGDHRFPGFNSRMDPIQALVLLCKLPYLEEWTQMRVDTAHFYMKNIKNTEITLPIIRPNSLPVWHLFVVKTKNREKLKEYLSDLGIESAVQYPMCLPGLPAYGADDRLFPFAARQCREILSLPMFSQITMSERLAVCEALNDYKS
jgi:dTDP-4-amino-4,6-dideoxygalactose transaminase